jgi:hypothetical protein
MLQVDDKNKELFSYLQKESTFIETNTFAFTSSHIAADVLSHFLFYYLKKNSITLMIKQNSLKEHDISYFKRFISAEQSEKIFLSISSSLYQYFTEQDMFSLEGFLRFRLKKQTAEVKTLIEDAFSFYNEHTTESENIQLFREMVDTQPSLEKELFLIVKNNQNVLLKGQKTIHLTDTTSNEDNILMHCILLAPNFLHVFDSSHLLSKETVVLLKKIFREKVNFYEGDHIEHSN